MSAVLTLDPATRREPTPAASGPIISLDHVSVAYGPVQAVRDVSFSVEAGEIFGLLGPNGAGKTTALAAIEGLVRPQAGRVLVGGLDVQTQAQAVKRLLGISLQSNAFFDNLKLWELVRFYAGLYEVFLSKREVLALLDRFELGEKAEVQVQQLSGGQQQRVALALALANNPQIVILDEPTTGLDPQARRSVWEVIRQIRAEERTVLLTTHYMEEAQELCHRVGILDGGQLIALDTPGGLINSLQASSQITATLRLPESAVRALPGVTDVRTEGARLTVNSTEPHATMLGLQRLAVETEQLLTDLSIKQPDLEDVFIARTGRTIR